DVHWVAADPDEPDHGSGRSGRSTPAGTMTVVSVVHGDWEVRVVHVQNLADTARAVQAGGWVLSDDAGITVATGPQRVDAGPRPPGLLRPGIGAGPAPGPRAQHRAGPAHPVHHLAGPDRQHGAPTRAGTALNSPTDPYEHITRAD